jgi:membrane protein implicated in regulation of membrane protease activity
MLFMLFVAAIAAVVLPAVLILALPISPVWKVVAVVILAVVDIAVPAIYVYRISSEQHWIKASRADEFIKDAMNN